MPRGPESYSGIEKQQAPTHERHRPRQSHEDFKPNPEAEAQNLESARTEALRQAAEHPARGNEASNESADLPLDLKSSKVARKLSFNKTMDRVHKQMPPYQAAFSKVIHNPVVERVTEVIGSTVARPDAILSGSIGALLITGALYLTARYYGFALSGSETILAFVGGWALGMLYDLIRVTILRRR